MKKSENNIMNRSIFIHSLFRSGSTYIFSVFRRNDKYYNYYEPFHHKLNDFEDKMFLDNDYVKLRARALNHQALNKPYFFEYNILRDDLNQYFKPEYSYKFFSMKKDDENADIKAYINLLIENTNKIPVFHFCRSVFRSDWLHKNFKATRIYLFRNPRDQWESYRKHNLFKAFNILIFESLLDRIGSDNIQNELNIDFVDNDSLKIKLKTYSNLYLNKHQQYLLFYWIWILSLLDNFFKADISLNIDLLNTSSNYREDIIKKLYKYNIQGLDFSDCNIRQRYFIDEDSRFFNEVEDNIHQLLIEKYSHVNLDSLLIDWNYQDRKTDVAKMKDELYQSRREINNLYDRILLLENIHHVSLKEKGVLSKFKMYVYRILNK